MIHLLFAEKIVKKCKFLLLAESTLLLAQYFSAFSRDVSAFSRIVSAFSRSVSAFSRNISAFSRDISAAAEGTGKGRSGLCYSSVGPVQLLSSGLVEILCF